MFIKKKKVIEKGRQDGEYRKRKFEIIVKRSHWHINCFQSHYCLRNVVSGDYKEQNRKSLPIEESDMSVQEYIINRYDYKKMKYSPRAILTIFVKTLHHHRLLT